MKDWRRMAGGVTELGYLGISVCDIDAWKAFAADILGLEVVPGRDPGNFTLRMDYWFQRLIVRQGEADDVDFVGWRVADAAAFEAIGERLRAAGIKYEVASPQQVAARQVLGLMTLTDPAGVPTEIFYGPRIEYALPFYPGRRMHGPFVTGERGLGHFVVNTSHVVECENFYQNILGMRGSVEFDRQLPPEAGGHRIRIHFMSCNSRQHSIAFGDLGPGKRLNHVMTEVARLEDVGLTRDIVKRHAVPIWLDIGQHHNDRGVSFYFATPSGWSWECGWGVVSPSGQAEWAEEPIWGHEHVARHAPPSEGNG